MKINVSCYRYVIKLIFDLDGPRFKKLVPARLPSPCLEKYIKKTTLQIEKMRTIENVMCARYSGILGLALEKVVGVAEDCDIMEKIDSRFSRIVKEQHITS